LRLTVLAPPLTSRRLALQLAKSAVTRPGTIRHRLNTENLASWWRFRQTRMRCNLCGRSGRPLFEMPDVELFRLHHIEPLRETLRCRGCGSKMRDRTIAAGLLDMLADRFGVYASTLSELTEKMPPEVRILDTDANSRFSARLAGSAGYIRSLYLPDTANGETLDDDRTVNVDLQSMPFKDASFDFVITTEVMEHVRHVDLAHAEIARCLDDDGVYLFTVPYDPKLSETWVLIDPTTDEPLVLPLHIHGDPGVRSEGIKSYRVFGRDLPQKLASVGLEAEVLTVDRPEVGIFGGDLWIAIKR
jgi:SAM-dependent methyltransferase